jgi:hypothetical protein
VGFEPTNGGFADLWGFSILLTRLACTPFQLALFTPCSELSLLKSCSSFWPDSPVAKRDKTCQTSGPSQGTIDYMQLPLEELLERLPTQKIKKQREKPVEVSRRPEEQEVLEELWKRYLIHHEQEAHPARVRGVCPNDGRDHYYAAVMEKAKDAFMRLVIKDRYKDFFYFVDKLVYNKARDLRREITGQRPLPPPDPDEEEQPIGEVSVEELTEKGHPGPSVPPLDPELIDVRRAIEEYMNESPERAASLFTLIERDGRKTPWAEFVNEFPWSEKDQRLKFGAKKNKIKAFVDDDKIRLEKRLTGRG